MMSDFRELTQVDGGISLACSAAGELLAINDARGRVHLFAGVDGRPLPLELDATRVRAVLLHPDGRRVCSLVGEVQPLVQVHDAWTGALLKVLDPGIEVIENDSEDWQHPEDLDAGEHHAAIQRLAASVLEHPAPQLRELSLEALNHDRRVAWLSRDSRSSERIERMALHANGRWLGVLDRGCFVIDIESGELLSRYADAIDLTMLFEYGEGTVSIGFDQRGALLLGRMAVSGNPYFYVDRHDPVGGDQLVRSENWEQVWFEQYECHIYDPTTLLPPSLIPEGEFVIQQRRDALEVWSRAGLQRSHPLPPRTCVVPSFDLGNFCTQARALLVDDGELELLDLLTGVRVPVRPRTRAGEPLGVDDLRWIELEPDSGALLLWTDAELLTWSGGEAWRRAQLPGHQIVQRFVSAQGELLHAAVLDAQGRAWVAELELEALRMPAPDALLLALETELLTHPHDAERFAVWADALSERGDVRGELVLLQQQGHTREAEALLRSHAASLLPGLRELAPERRQLRWQWGVVREATFELDNREQLAEVLCWLGSPSARLLERLELRFADSMEPSFRAKLEASTRSFLEAGRRWPYLGRSR